MTGFLRSSLVLTTIGLMVVGCSKSQDPAAEQEIEKRVQERLAEEHRVQQEQQVKEREAVVAQREQDLASKETELRERERAAAVAQEQARQRDLAARTPTEDSTPEQKAEEPAPAPRDDDRYSYDEFYDKLQPDGEWFETPQYGYVWRPRVAVLDLGWRPYVNGRWVYTDYGWTWVSEERFGWACYHYGRWVRLAGIGWVWLPGHEWAPAWVSWRMGDDFIGWAPLGPGIAYGDGESYVDVAVDYGPSYYTFVSADHFCEGALAPYVVNVQKNVTIINKTKNITKIIKNVKKKVVYNVGPDLPTVERKTNRKVVRLRVEQKQDAKPATVQGDVIKVAAVSVPEKGRGADLGRKPAARKLEKIKVEKDAPIGQTISGHSSSPPTPAQGAQTEKTPQQLQTEAIQREQERQKKLAERMRAQRQLQVSAPEPSNTAPSPVPPAAISNQVPSPQSTSLATQQELIRQEQERIRRLQKGEQKGNADRGEPDADSPRLQHEAQKQQKRENGDAVEGQRDAQQRRERREEKLRQQQQEQQEAARQMRLQAEQQKEREAIQRHAQERLQQQGDQQKRYNATQDNKDKARQRANPDPTGTPSDDAKGSRRRGY